VCPTGEGATPEEWSCLTCEAHPTLDQIDQMVMAEYEVRDHMVDSDAHRVTQCCIQMVCI
jgi:hypothetical protein